MRTMCVLISLLPSCNEQDSEPSPQLGTSDKISSSAESNSSSGSGANGGSDGWVPTEYCEAICDYMYACREDEIEEFSYYEDYEDCVTFPGGFCGDSAWEIGPSFDECIDCFVELSETCEEGGNVDCASMSDCLYYIGE
jgi:hypothetical protein